MMKEKSVLGLVITDGVGYRNFVLSDFLRQSLKQFAKVIVFSGLPKEVYDLGDLENIRIIELPIYRETSQSWFWRKFKEIAHLQLHKNFYGIHDNLKANYPRSYSKRSFFTRGIFLVTTFLHSEKFILKLEKKQQKVISKQKIAKDCEEILIKYPVDILFFTHQRPPYVLPVITAAKKCRVTTGAFIFSWDNLSSKGRMAATFDKYIVWSELMKKELLYFYPLTKSESVIIGGTPQFVPYVLLEYSRKREDFYRTFNLNVKSKTICYSCGDSSTSKNDELYISIIADAFLNSKLDKEVNFIVRTSPAEDPKRFYDLQERYPFIVWNFPKWYLARKGHPEPWSQRIPSKEDLADLRSLLEFCDININMCSTMSLDFMLFDKPVINPVLGNESNDLYNDQRFLKFGHYLNVLESKSTKIVKTEKELIDAINIYLEFPEQQQKERNDLINMQIGVPLKKISNTLTEELLNFTE
jgi:hypothetical protein